MATETKRTSLLGGVIRITVGMALDRLTKFNINLLKMFDGDAETTQNIGRIMYVEDDKLVSLYKFFYNEIHKKEPTIEQLDLIGGEELEAFRDEVWEAIENFSPSRRRNLVRELRFQIEEMFQNLSLKESSSDSPEEPESSPGTSPLES